MQGIMAFLNLEYNGDVQHVFLLQYFPEGEKQFTFSPHILITSYTIFVSTRAETNF